MDVDEGRVTVERRGPPLAAGDAREACLVLLYPPGMGLGQRFDLEDEVLVGRSPQAHLRLDRDFVSRRHARFERRGRRWRVVDEGSKNGTYVNGVRVDEARLADGDLVVIGDVILKFLTGSSLELSYHEELYRLTGVDDLTHAY